MLLDSEKRKLIQDEFNTVKTSNLIEPMERTALPDQTIIQIKLQIGDSKKIDLKFLSDDRNKLNADGTKLMSVIRDIISEIRKTKPLILNKNISNLTRYTE